MADAKSKPRLLLLCTTTGYQTQAFVEAAEKLGLEVVFATDRCHVLEDPWQDGALPLRFEDPEAGAQRIAEYARTHAIAALVSIGDRPTPTAARACRALGLLSHPPEAADTCRDKYRSRERLRLAGLNVPGFSRFPVDADPRRLVAAGAVGLASPWVLKPLALAASRGVIRADTAEEFVRAFERIQALLRTPEVGALREETSNFIQVESYVEGAEIAVEGIVDRGRLRILAIFDKPDPLVGPFFEETIYVTPSRLAPETQQHVLQTLDRAVQALGLYHGPLHAELRINSNREDVWVMEVAARPIGGLCSRALRFRIPLVDDNISLEELLIRLALGLEVSQIYRENAAAGVMMIPIPEAGFYQETQGVDEATPGIEEVHITVKVGQKLVPLPEGSSYLGFIFGRGQSPEFVEDALRRAHEKLRFVLTPALPMI
ncbi:MAG TPA: ATP-grasp domain-containing protein [Terriglobales bacterium]|nr:ATP-grasp domain-containing protein [Terriglobales bacterium]